MYDELWPLVFVFCSHLLACSHCHRNRVPECSGGSVCSGASEGEDQEERVKEEEGGEKRGTEREKEKQREGEVREGERE